jgi:hypothetical protein
LPRTRRVFATDRVRGCGRPRLRRSQNAALRRRSVGHRNDGRDAPLRPRFRRRLSRSGARLLPTRYSPIGVRRNKSNSAPDGWKCRPSSGVSKATPSSWWTRIRAIYPSAIESPWRSSWGGTSADDTVTDHIISPFLQYDHLPSFASGASVGRPGDSIRFAHLSHLQCRLRQEPPWPSRQARVRMLLGATPSTTSRNPTPNRPPRLQCRGRIEASRRIGVCSCQRPFAPFLKTACFALSSR